MCGICGILHTGPVEPTASAPLVETMTDALAHRGPSDRGTYSDERVSLGSRRLSVIDLSPAGRMPMSNEDGSVQIVFNGEVYNFRELKQQFALEAKGHVFRSRTDTEVILHLYEELGMGMLPLLNGMFAFAIWDVKRGQLHLARDRFGIKPLFFTWQGARLLFASEIKSILKDPSVPRKPDFQALHDFLTFDYVPGAQTAFVGIEELAPGHALTASDGGEVRRWRYWKPAFEVDESMTISAAIAGAREQMERAVERQLVADVPIGVLLSGGMDSSTLVALMGRRQSAPFHTYSVGFGEQSFNELPFARIVADQFRTVHREVVVTPDLVRDLLPDYLKWIDEPYADGSAIPTYYVCRLATKEVVVVLSGEGGDEVFAGYETHAAYQASRWFGKIPRWIRRGLIAPVVNSLPVSHKKLSLEFKMKRFLSGQDLPPAQAHLWWRIVMTEAEKRNLYTSRVLEQLEPQSSERHFTEVFERSRAQDTLNRLLEIDTSVFLPDDLMIKNDRMSMAHSIEARVPFTDNELVNYMARVPARMKLPRLEKKYIMRQAMAGTLPPSIINKKKVGLEMPYSQWFRAQLKDLLLNYCSPERCEASGLFRPDAVRAVIDKHLEGRRDNGRALWGLLNYMMWLDLYVL